MESDFRQHDSLTYIFTIPNVSKLLVYKDHWNESRIMREVIAAVLDNKLSTKLYLGSKHKKFEEHFFTNFEDCAIISIRIHGLHSLNYAVENIEALFVKELRNSRNVLHFDNTRLSLDNNVSAIDVSIKICQAYKANEAENDAA